MTPLDYAKAACDTLMRRYAAPDLPPKPQFHYHQGVFLSGMYQTYQLCQEEKYFQYMKDWIDSAFQPDGSIVYCHFSNPDDIMPGILLFPIPRYHTGYVTIIDGIYDISVLVANGTIHHDMYFLT